MGEEHSLLDASLLFPFEDHSTVARVMEQLLRDDGETVGHIVEALLLYDRVTFPSVDMSIVPLLALAIGPQNVATLLESGGIAIVRYSGAVCYVGAGNGLEMFQLLSPQNPPEGYRRKRVPNEVVAEQWTIDDAASTPLDQSLHTMMKAFHLGDFFDREVLMNLEKTALKHSSEVSSDVFRPAFEETYRDVKGSESLTKLFSLRNQNLKRLKGVDDNQVRWLHTRHWNDEIDILLHMAQFNVEASLARLTGCADQTSGPSAKTWVAAKQERLAGYKASSFTRLATIDRVPNVSLLADDDTALDCVLALSRSGQAQRFRDWFHREVMSGDPDAIVAAYVDLLKAPNLADLPLVRALRFIASTGLSALAGAAGGPLASLSVSAADAFFVEGFLKRGPAPKVFLAELHGAAGNLSGMADP